MRTPTSLLAVVAASLAALAPQDALAAVPADGATAPAVNVAASPWMFAKSPAPWARHAVAARTSGLDAMIFGVSASAVAATRVTRMAFMVTGTVQAGDVANFQIVSYPNGLASPGVVVGSSSGAGFTPGRTTSIVSIDLAAPVALQGDYTGVFALRVDVNGARPFSFQPQLQTVTIESDGVESYLLATEDLPLHGDSFYVN